MHILHKHNNVLQQLHCSKVGYSKHRECLCKPTDG